MQAQCSFEADGGDSDATRLWVDDTLVVDGWTTGPNWKPTGVFTNATAGLAHRIRLEHNDTGGNAQLELHWDQPPGCSGTCSGAVPNQYLRPRYNLVTSSVDADGHRVDTAHNGDTRDPALGLVTSTSVDPAGLNLTTRLEPLAALAFAYAMVLPRV